MAENRGHIAFLLSEFNVPHLLATYKAMQGDVALAIVLGEIAQHNVRRFFADPRLEPGTGAERVLESQELRHPMVSGCNALSISRSTGIARETVRRKVVQLLRRKWVIRDGRGNLLLAPGVVDEFASFNEASLASFLDVAGRLQRLLDTAPRAREAAADGNAGPARTQGGQAQGR